MGRPLSHPSSVCFFLALIAGVVAILSPAPVKGIAAFAVVEFVLLQFATSDWDR